MAASHTQRISTRLRGNPRPNKPLQATQERSPRSTPQPRWGDRVLRGRIVPGPTRVLLRLGSPLLLLVHLAPGRDRPTLSLQTSRHLLPKRKRGSGFLFRPVWSLLTRQGWEMGRMYLGRFPGQFQCRRWELDHWSGLLRSGAHHGSDCRPGRAPVADQDPWNCPCHPYAVWISGPVVGRFRAGSPRGHSQWCNCISGR